VGGLIVFLETYKSCQSGYG